MSILFLGVRRLLLAAEGQTSRSAFVKMWTGTLKKGETNSRDIINTIY